MSEKLDLSLPEKKIKKPASRCLANILLFLLIAAVVINIAMQFNRPNKVAQMQSGFGNVKELAMKLSARNLDERAAEVWQEYLLSGRLSNDEKARALYQVAVLYEKAGLYAEAIEYYYRSEMTAEIKELVRAINVHIKNCFERLGNFSALRYEMADRTSVDRATKAGTKIVAQIGAEKITQAEVDAKIEMMIENQLSAYSAFMSTEQLNAQKKQMLEQFQDGKAKQGFLQQWLAQELLYRQGLQDGLMDDRKMQSQLAEITRSILSQHVMDTEVAAKVNVTETDVKMYYETNKEKYTEPADEEKGTEQRQKNLDEAREQVTAELVDMKKQEVQQAYIKSLMDKYDVVIHGAGFIQEDSQEDK